MEPDVRAAIDQSTLRLLPADRLEALLADAVAIELPRGGPYHSNGTQPPPGIVLSGLIRVCGRRDATVPTGGMNR